jgi:hypothetical protein
MHKENITKSHTRVSFNLDKTKIMFGETITHTGSFETLYGIMIMLGFNTTMSGKSIIDQMEIFHVVSNPYPFSFQKQFHHREKI